MDGLNGFFEESPISERVSLPAHIVVRELTLSSSAVKRMMESGSFTPLGGHVCDLELGGRCVASGRIVRRRGNYFFKTASIWLTGRKEANQPRQDPCKRAERNGKTDGSIDPLLLAAVASARLASLPGDAGNPFLLNLLYIRAVGPSENEAQGNNSIGSVPIRARIGGPGDPDYRMEKGGE
jgi:hypothetical protein